jgi:hypothetical protein
MDARRTQLGFSATIWKIEPRICLEILRPPPTRFRTPQSMAQYSLNPARCQRTTVSGWTRKSASFHCDQSRRTTTQNSLSSGPSLGLGFLRFKTASCCRRVRFSSNRLRRSRKMRSTCFEPEPKKVEHGGKVITDRIVVWLPMLLIAKRDNIVTRHSLHKLEFRSFPAERPLPCQF